MRYDHFCNHKFCGLLYGAESLVFPMRIVNVNNLIMGMQDSELITLAVKYILEIYCTFIIGLCNVSPGSYAICVSVGCLSFYINRSLGILLQYVCDRFTLGY